MPEGKGKMRQGKMRPEPNRGTQKKRQAQGLPPYLSGRLPGRYFAPSLRTRAIARVLRRMAVFRVMIPRLASLSSMEL